MQVSVPTKRYASFGKTVSQEDHEQLRKQYHMKQCDRLVDQYMEEYDAAGRVAETVIITQSRAK
jgi:hypothetical protein